MISPGPGKRTRLSTKQLRIRIALMRIFGSEGRAPHESLAIGILTTSGNSLAFEEHREYDASRLAFFSP